MRRFASETERPGNLGRFGIFALAAEFATWKYNGEIVVGFGKCTSYGNDGEKAKERKVTVWLCQSKPANSNRKLQP